jgi:hypothetical protein
MSAPKHAAIVGKSRNGMRDNFVISDGAGLLIRDIEMVTTNEPHPQHNARHTHAA